MSYNNADKHQGIGTYQHANIFLKHKNEYSQQ